MRTLEDLIRPPMLARSWPRDLLAAALLAALAAVLLPALLAHGSAAPAGTYGPPGEPDLAVPLASIETLMDRVGSIYLLMAMGMMLCLRCGAIDLSVWVVYSLGGLVAAGCILAGVPAWASLLIGAGAGAAVGAANGLLTAVARLPSLLVTLPTGLGILWLMHRFCPDRQVALPEPSVFDWLLPTQRLTRMFLVAGTYSLVMLVLMAADWVRPGAWRPGSRKALWAAMTACGALSAAAGAIDLVDRNVAQVATRLVDNLTPPVAAVLAGGVFLAGRGRTLLAGVFLPPALLLAELWWEHVILYQPGGYSLQLVLLLCMVLGVQQAGRDYSAGPHAGKGLPALAALLGSAGIVLAGAGANVSIHSQRLFETAGLLVWMLSAVIVVIYRARSPRGP